MYQGGRTIRDSQLNPNQPSTILPPPANDVRYTRDTFISDEPSPLLKPVSPLYNRETIQSQ